MKCRRELKRIGRSQRMNSKESRRSLSYDLTGFDLVPSVGKPFQAVVGKRGSRCVKLTATLQPGQRRNAVHFRSPPHQYLGIASRRAASMNVSGK
jgi:hypothetical protein